MSHATSYSKPPLPPVPAFLSVSKNACTASTSVSDGRLAIVAVKVIFPELSSETWTVVRSGPPTLLSPLGSVNIFESSVRAV